MRKAIGFLGGYSRDQYLAAALLLLICFVYLPVRHFVYVNYDDPDYVTGNLTVLDGLSVEGLRYAFTSTRSSNWFPLTWLSLMTDCQIYGSTPGPLHWTNVMLHAASTLLLFWLLKRMTGASAPSAIVAFLFALHPLRVESVAWISERKDVLSGLFWMLALGSYARYAARPTASAYVLTLLLYCLGFLSKPMVVSLPLVLLLLDIWPLQRISLMAGSEERIQQGRRLVREKAPFFLLAAIMSVTTYVVQKQGGAVRTLDQFALGARLQNALVSAVVYIAKTFWPTDLAVFYPFPAKLAVWQVTAAGLFLAGMTVLVLRLLRTRPYLAVGWFWYLITLLPVIGIVQVGDQARADRYTYIPGIGLLLMLVWSAADAWRRAPKARVPLAVLCGAVCLASVAVTRKQLLYWRDSEALFRHTIEVTDNNLTAHLGLANCLRDQGLNEQAIAEYRTVLDISPHYTAGLLYLSDLLTQLGRVEEAMPLLTERVQLDPGNAVNYYDLGQGLARKGQPNEASVQFQEALRLKPEYADAHVGLGLALMDLGKVEQAKAQFSEALRIEPESEAASRNLRRAVSALQSK